eukprot:2115935-Rhodomonas_salina.2
MVTPRTAASLADLLTERREVELLARVSAMVLLMLLAREASTEQRSSAETHRKKGFGKSLPNAVSIRSSMDCCSLSLSVGASCTSTSRWRAVRASAHGWRVLRAVAGEKDTVCSAESSDMSSIELWASRAEPAKSCQSRLSTILNQSLKTP